MSNDIEMLESKVNLHLVEDTNFQGGNSMQPQQLLPTLPCVTGATHVNCLDSLQLPFPMENFLNSTNSGSISKLRGTIAVESKLLLTNNNFSLLLAIKLTSLPKPFEPWHETHESNDIVDCVWSEMSTKSPIFSVFSGILNISENGQRIQLLYNPMDSGLPQTYEMNKRIGSIEKYFSTTISQAMSQWQLTSFPNIKLLVYFGNDELDYPALAVVNSICGSIPLFSHRKGLQGSNTMVLYPDYSYFQQDLTESQSSWVDSVNAELKSVVNKNLKSNYERRPFLNKFPTLIFRRTSSRDDNLENAIAACTKNVNVDVRANFLSAADMCGRHQAVVATQASFSQPSNYKYLLLCNSVPIIVGAKEAGGESWETRLEMGLEPWVHYLPLIVKRGDVCSQLDNFTTWLAAFPQEAESMAYRSRELVLPVLLEYAMLFRDETFSLQMSSKIPKLGPPAIDRRVAAAMQILNQKKFNRNHLNWKDTKVKTASELAKLNSQSSRAVIEANPPSDTTNKKTSLRGVVPSEYASIVNSPAVANFSVTYERQFRNRNTTAWQHRTAKSNAISAARKANSNKSSLTASVPASPVASSPTTSLTVVDVNAGRASSQVAVQQQSKTVDLLKKAESVQAPAASASSSSASSTSPGTVRTSSITSPIPSSPSIVAITPSKPATPVSTPTKALATTSSTPATPLAKTSAASTKSAPKFSLDAILHDFPEIINQRNPRMNPFRTRRRDVNHIKEKN